MVGIASSPDWIGTGIIERCCSWGDSEQSCIKQGSQTRVTLTTDPSVSDVFAAIQPLFNDQTQSVNLDRIDQTTWVMDHSWDELGAFDIYFSYQLDERLYQDQIAPKRVVVFPEQQNQWRIYTLIPRVSGNMGQWKADLQRIQDLGFNAVHILPINSRDKSLSPYASVDAYAIDMEWLDPASSAKSEDQWQAFVDELTRRNMHLGVDLVVNHVGLNHSFAKQHRSWLTSDSHEEDGLKRAGWRSADAWHSWRDLLLLNYDVQPPSEQELLWQAMTDYASYWAAFAAQTNGFVRLDNLHSSHPGFMRHLMAYLRNKYPNLVIFGELFGEEQHIRRLTGEYGLQLLLATMWEHKFTPELRRYLQYLHAQSGQLNYFCPVGSHDSHSIPEEFGSIKSTFPRLAVSALLGSGPWGMDQGVEYAVHEKIPFIGPLFEHRFTEMDGKIADWIRILNRISEDEPVLHEAGNITFVDQDHGAVLAAVRASQANNQALLCLINLDIQQPQEIEIKLNDDSSSQKWLDLLTGSTDHLPERHQLNPGQVKIFRLV